MPDTLSTLSPRQRDLMDLLGKAETGMNLSHRGITTRSIATREFAIKRYNGPFPNVWTTVRSLNSRGLLRIVHTGASVLHVQLLPAPDIVENQHPSPDDPDAPSLPDAQEKILAILQRLDRGAASAWHHPQGVFRRVSGGRIGLPAASGTEPLKSILGSLANRGFIALNGETASLSEAGRLFPVRAQFAVMPPPSHNAPPSFPVPPSAPSAPPLGVPPPSPAVSLPAASTPPTGEWRAAVSLAVPPTSATTNAFDSIRVALPSIHTPAFPPALPPTSTRIHLAALYLTRWLAGSELEIDLPMDFAHSYTEFGQMDDALFGLLFEPLSAPSTFRVCRTFWAYSLSLFPAIGVQTYQVAPQDVMGVLFAEIHTIAQKWFLLNGYPDNDVALLLAVQIQDDPAGLSAALVGVVNAVKVGYEVLPLT